MGIYIKKILGNNAARICDPAVCPRFLCAFMIVVLSTMLGGCERADYFVSGLSNPGTASLVSKCIELRKNDLIEDSTVRDICSRKHSLPYSNYEEEVLRDSLLQHGVDMEFVDAMLTMLPPLSGKAGYSKDGASFSGFVDNTTDAFVVTEYELQMRYRDDESNQQVFRHAISDLWLLPGERHSFRVVSDPQSIMGLPTVSFECDFPTPMKNCWESWSIPSETVRGITID